MSTQLPQADTSYFPPMPNHPPVKPKAKRKWLVPVLMIAALLLGIGFGSIKPTPDPVTITKEVPVEKRVEVPVTPTACGTALTLYDQLVGYSTEALGYSNEALQSAAKLDAAGIYAANDKVKTLTPKIDTLAPLLRAAKDTCRASLK
jgi:hypothetical protein